MHTMRHNAVQVEAGGGSSSSGRVSSREILMGLWKHRVQGKGNNRLHNPVGPSGHLSNSNCLMGPLIYIYIYIALETHHAMGLRRCFSSCPSSYTNLNDNRLVADSTTIRGGMYMMPLAFPSAGGLGLPAQTLPCTVLSKGASLYHDGTMTTRPLVRLPCVRLTGVALFSTFSPWSCFRLVLQISPTAPERADSPPYLISIC